MCAHLYCRVLHEVNSMAVSEPVHVDLLSFTYQRQLRQASGKGFYVC